jgi:hypothetical protein
MIEYTLISSILDRICEMIIAPLEFPRDLTMLDPPQVVTRNQNMGNRMEKPNWQNKWMGRHGDG